MKHKTWFRLVLQASGVLLIGLGITEFVSAIAIVIWMFEDMPQFMSISPWRWIVHAVGPAVQLAIGFYLLTGAPWLLNKIIPSNRPYCPEFGYDLSHNSGPKCCECGVTLPEKLTRQGGESSTTTDV